MHLHLFHDAQFVQASIFWCVFTMMNIMNFLVHSMTRCLHLNTHYWLSELVIGNGCPDGQVPHQPDMAGGAAL
jgi:hypothetical protein